MAYKKELYNFLACINEYCKFYYAADSYRKGDIKALSVLLDLFIIFGFLFLVPFICVIMVIILK